MTDAAPSRLKVSRQGLALIKALEGFRPRAARLGGRWVIGYGHTASAREGATVTAADAELLLQYDLAPVVRALNDSGAALSQNQFDALASYALSVGLDQFHASDVLRRLQAGEPAGAARALLARPAPVSEDAGLRRRAAERALFDAAPGADLSVAALLASPLPSPSAPRPVQAAQARAAAVASLLGEDASRPAPAADPLPTPDAFPTEIEPEPVPTPAPVAEPVADADAPVVPQLSRPAAPSPAPPHVRPVMRHETVGIEASAPAAWGELGLYAVMGVLGLIACAFAGAAFRWSLLRPSTTGEPASIAWALAVVGVLCVGLSAWNLYVHWGRRG